MFDFEKQIIRENKSNLLFIGGVFEPFQGVVIMIDFNPDWYRVCHTSHLLLELYFLAELVFQFENEHLSLKPELISQLLVYYFY